MPLLFFVSGMLCSRYNKFEWEVVKRNVQKKVFRILIPYLSTGFLLYFYKGTYGYWFLGAIFWIYIIFWGCSFMLYRMNIKGSIWITMILFAMSLLLICVSWKLPATFNNITYFHLGAKNFLPFLFGYAFNKNGIDKICNKSIVNLILLCLYFTMLFVKDSYDVGRGMLGNMLYVFISISIIIPLISFFREYTPANMVSKIIIRFFSYLGKKSLQYYIVHLYFVVCFTQIGDFILSIDHPVTSVTFQLLYAGGVSLISVFFSTIVIRVLERNCICSLIIFGIKKNE